MRLAVGYHDGDPRIASAIWGRVGQRCQDQNAILGTLCFGLGIRELRRSPIFDMESPRQYPHKFFQPLSAD